MEEKANLKPINSNVIIKTTLVFYEEPQQPDTFGSNDIVYEIYYDTKKGIMSVEEVGAFGDRTLVKRFWDKHNRKIELKEMLENIEQMSNMTYKEFKNLLGE